MILKTMKRSQKKIRKIEEKKERYFYPKELFDFFICGRRLESFVSDVELGVAVFCFEALDHTFLLPLTHPAFSYFPLEIIKKGKAEEYLTIKSSEAIEEENKMLLELFSL